MKLLMIGGTGVLSTAIATEAIKRNIDVTMINRGNNQSLIPKSATLLKARVNDTEKVKGLLEGKHFDAVIDFICYTKSQIENSFNLFKNYSAQYIFISSTAVYNTKVCDSCDEDSPKVLDVWQYSADKVNCENYLIDIAKRENKPYTIIRPSVTYGNTRIPYGIMPPYGYHGTILERIKHGKPIITWDGGICRCNIMRVEDFAIGGVGLIGNKAAYNEAFNICGDETPSWQEVLSTLSKVLGIPIKTFDISSVEYSNEIPSRKGEIIGGRAIDAISNNSKIKKVVPEFCQNIFLHEGMNTTVNHYEHQLISKTIKSMLLRN